MRLQTWLLSFKDMSLPSVLSDQTLFLGEAPGTVALCYHGDRPEAEWTRMDVFTEEWDLRVQRLGSQARVVAAGPVPGTDTWGEPAASQPLGEASTETRHALLWGRRNEGESMWIELRIPHLMTAGDQLHPEGHGQAHTDKMVRRRLRIVRHTDPHGGEVLFQRYAGLDYARTDADDTSIEPISAS